MFLVAVAFPNAIGQSVPWTMGLLYPPKQVPYHAAFGSVTCFSYKNLFSCLRPGTAELVPSHLSLCSLVDPWSKH